MDEKERLKQIPLIMMLFAAGLTAVISLFSEITFGMFLLRIFIASIAFYVVGTVVQILFVYAIKREEVKKEEEKDHRHGHRAARSEEEATSDETDHGSDEEDEEDEGY